MNTSLSLTKYLLSLNLAIVIIVNFAVFVLILTSKLPVPSPLLSSISPRLDFYSTLSQHTFFISSIVTLARPPTLSSLKITNRSFRYAAPCLWNELPTDLRKPRQTQCPALSPITHGSSSSSLSPIASSLIPSVFHSELKTWLFSKSFPPYTFSFLTGLIRRTLGPSNDFTLLNGWICLHGVLD